MKTAAVIGLGDVSALHLAAIDAAPGAALAAVCDVDESARERAPKGVPFFTDYREMIGAVRPDAVHLCLPHYLHYPVAKEAVELGCSVFCEKPMAVSPAQAAQFAELEEAHPELQIGICLQNRLNETVTTLKSLLDSGEYGKVRGARGFVPWFRSKSYYDVKPWRGRMETAGGGCMMNQSIHTLDLLYYLCGPVIRLRGSVSQMLDYGLEVEDTVTARLEFAGGASGLFAATNANYENESIQISVAAERAVFTIQNSLLTRTDPDGAVTRICEDAQLPGTKFYYGASHAKLIGSYYAALETGGGGYIHARDAVMSILLIAAINKSSAEGAAVVPGKEFASWINED